MSKTLSPTYRNADLGTPDVIATINGKDFSRDVFAEGRTVSFGDVTVEFPSLSSDVMMSAEEDKSFNAKALTVTTPTMKVEA